MYITPEEIITVAKANLGIEHTSDKDYLFRIWIGQAMRQVDSYDIFCKQNELLKVEDMIEAVLPKDFKQLLGYRMVNKSVPTVSPAELADPNVPAGGKTVDVIDSPFWDLGEDTYVDTKWLNTCGVSANNVLHNFNDSAQIIHGVLRFNAPVSYTHVQLAYYGLNKDKHGRWNIPDDFDRALAAYCSYRYAMPRLKHYGNLYKDWQREWEAQKVWLKGVAIRNHAEANRETLMQYMNNLFVNNIPYKYG